MGVNLRVLPPAGDGVTRVLVAPGDVLRSFERGLHVRLPLCVHKELMSTSSLPLRPAYTPLPLARSIPRAGRRRTRGVPGVGPVEPQRKPFGIGGPTGGQEGPKRIKLTPTPIKSLIGLGTLHLLSVLLP